jgi:hypothetical protein
MQLPNMSSNTTIEIYAFVRLVSPQQITYYQSTNAPIATIWGCLVHVSPQLGSHGAARPVSARLARATCLCLLACIRRDWSDTTCDWSPVSRHQPILFPSLRARSHTFSRTARARLGRNGHSSRFSGAWPQGLCCTRTTWLGGCTRQPN